MIQNNKQTRVAIYIRVSTDDQVEKYGIPLQRASVDALIKSKGKLENGSDVMVLAGERYVYIDEGISGTIDFRERPAFARLVEDIELASEDEKPFDAVVVYKIDRFARRLKILLSVVEFLEENSIAFLSANESIDTSSPFGKAILGIIGVIAELEIETMRLRTYDGRMQAVDRGVIMGQATTYGFQKDSEGKLVVLQEEAEIVKNIFDWFVYERLSAQKIADRLRLQNVLSPDASAIKHNKRKGILRKKNEAHFWRMETVKDIL
jgi:site-specific DNA recombinase